MSESDDFRERLTEIRREQREKLAEYRREAFGESASSSLGEGPRDLASLRAYLKEHGYWIEAEWLFRDMD